MTFVGRVQGVVVQARNDARCRARSAPRGRGPGLAIEGSALSASTGKRAYREVCVMSLYEPVISCSDSAVPHRAHQGIARWPLYSQPFSWHSFKTFQMCEMLLSLYVKYELSQSIHCPSRMECFVIAAALR